MPSLMVEEDCVGLDYAFSMDDWLQMQWPGVDNFDTYSR